MAKNLEKYFYNMLESFNKISMIISTDSLSVEK